MYDRRAASLLNEEDSTGEEIMSNGKEFFVPKVVICH